MYVWGIKCSAGSTNNWSENRTVYIDKLEDATAPTVTLNTPTDNYAITTHTIVFGGTGVDTETELTTASLYTNITGVWAVNETKSAINNTQVTFTEIFNVHKKNVKWNILMCNNAVTPLCAYAGANRTFNISLPVGYEYASETLSYAYDIRDGGMCNNAPTTNYGSTANVEFGAWDPGGDYRHGLFVWNISRLSNCSDKDIYNITANLYCIVKSGSTTAYRILVYQLTEDFVEEQMTWNVKSTGVNWATAGGTVNTSKLIYNTSRPSAVSTWNKYYVYGASAIRNMSATWNNLLGIRFNRQDELSATAPTGEYEQYASKEYATASLRPYLLVGCRKTLAVECEFDSDCGACEKCDASVCVNQAEDEDTKNECGVVQCDGGAAIPYYFGWNASFGCNYREDEANGACDGAGACKVDTDYCGANAEDGTSGVTCNCEDAEVGCTGTTIGSCNNTVCSRNIGLELITPTTNINVTHDTFFKIQVNVSCIGYACGDINVTLDPRKVGGIQ
jgi:hypothetical protein